jgi:hypothetical protein
MSEIVFLDTTIQIRRNYGSLEEIARIRWFALPLLPSCDRLSLDQQG